MLSTMRGYVDTGVAGLRNEMITCLDSLQLLINEIHRATIRPAQPINPFHSHDISGYDGANAEAVAQ